MRAGALLVPVAVTLGACLQAVDLGGPGYACERSVDCGRYGPCLEGICRGSGDGGSCLPQTLVCPPEAVCDDFANAPEGALPGWEVVLAPGPEGRAGYVRTLAGLGCNHTRHLEAALGDGRRAQVRRSVAAKSEVFVTAHLFVSSAPGDPSLELVRVELGGRANVVGLGAGPERRLLGQTADGGLVSGDAGVPLGRWFCLTAAVKASASNGRTRVWIDGAELPQLDFASATEEGSSDGGSRSVWLGVASSGAAAPEARVFVDHVQLGPALQPCIP